MEIIPAIDIRGGRCVRLHQGRYDRETVFDRDPVDAAQRWIDAGATRLHVVDLDGARSGDPVNLPPRRAHRPSGNPPAVRRRHPRRGARPSACSTRAPAA